MKWWFSDYDGTINVYHNEVLDKEDISFIKEWIDDGNKMVIASGRLLEEMQNMLSENSLKYDYLVLNNGACVYNKKHEIISHLTIPMELRKKILNVIDKYRSKYIFGYCIEDKRMDLWTHNFEYVNNDELLSTYAPKTNNWEKGSVDILNNDKLNLIYIYMNSDDGFDIKAEIEALGGVKAVRTHSGLLEIMNSNVSKAYGIEVLRKLEHFDTYDVYTSGDGENDIEMLEYTNNSFAMDTASDNVKAKAKHIIKRVREIKDKLVN